MSLVNYSDEYLTNNSSVTKASNIHKKIGGLILISTLMSFVGAGVLYFFVVDTIYINQTAFLISLASGIPMVLMYTSYFYLLTAFPVHQVAPLFQISSLWLLIIELAFGSTISPIAVVGILFLMYGAYLIDAGTFKWKIPTKLLLIAAPATSTWAISLFLGKLASQTANPITITFWQLVSIGTIGIFLFLFAKNYRDGFLDRIKNQGKTFLGLSLVNETFAEGSYLFSNLAVAAAPVAAFITALSGLQSVFVLLLFYFFPQVERTKITYLQMFATVLVAIGVFLIEK